MESVKSGESHKLAVFASGKGSNAQKIAEYFAGHQHISIALIVSSKASAGVLDMARAKDIPVLILEKERFMETGYADELRARGIDSIILAGFLWKVPPVLIAAYPNRILNIHPALLPAYGGKGMYGQKVHEAVIAAGETCSGITIHYVDEIYDHGAILFQKTCAVEAGDTWERVAKKVQELEHRHYPEQIEKWVMGRRK